MNSGTHSWLPVPAVDHAGFCWQGLCVEVQAVRVPAYRMFVASHFSFHSPKSKVIEQGTKNPI